MVSTVCSTLHPHMAPNILERPRAARKLAGERMAPPRHVSLPLPLDERLVTAADNRSLKGAIDALRRERRHNVRHDQRQSERAHHAPAPAVSTPPEKSE